MNKKPNQLSSLLRSPSTDVQFPPKRKSTRKYTRIPEPPTEETILRLNELVKQAPFCFYYHEKGNEFL